MSNKYQGELYTSNLSLSRSSKLDVRVRNEKTSLIAFAGPRATFDSLVASASKHLVISIIPCWTAASSSNFREDAAMIHFDTTTSISDTTTIADGFQDGQDAFACDIATHYAPQSEQELFSYLLSVISESFQPIVLNDLIIPPAPNFGIGFAAGYIQAYLETQK
jgi:hypothetical protein